MGGATIGGPVLEKSLWGMLYADNAGAVSQSPEQLRNMGVIVFGLTVSETKTEIMRLRTKGMSEFTAIFSIEAAGQVYNQTNDFVQLGGSVTHNADLFVEVNRRIYATYGAASGSTPSNCTTDRALSSSSKSGC